jgi:hypothetical protein
MNKWVVLLTAVWLGWPTLARAEVHGGIEIGAKGIRAIAVDVAAEGADSRILLLENQNTTLVADLATKMRFSQEALDKTVDIVGRLAQKIRDDFKLPEKRLYIVGSSGLFTPLEGNEELIKVNKVLLVEAIRKKTSITMDFVTITREAELTIVSVVPAKVRGDAVLLDIGSGNTKGGGETKDGKLLTLGINFGTVSFSDRVKKEADKAGFAETATKLRDQLVVPALEQALRDKKELLTRKRIFVAGGSVWAMTTFVKPLDRGNHVALAASDIGAFYKLLLANPEKLPDPDLSGGTEEARKLAITDLAQVRKTFTRDQLIAGIEILRALSTTFGFDAKDKHVVFARNAYIGWILGYTVEKGRAAK